MAQADLRALASALGLTVLQRDWLSANQVVFARAGATPSTVVDTGHARHADLTLRLVAHALEGAPLERIVNTHLHSDHCGGNRALQQVYRAQTLVPLASLEAVRQWNESRLSYRATGQFCERFVADGALIPGARLCLGPREWEVIAAPGHDPEAVLLFEPRERCLIAGDALWEDRLAIIFPELDDEPGFVTAAATLDLIEALAPHWVIPGHGDCFQDVASAIAASRSRLAVWRRKPEQHAQHAARALLMFHMMEMQTASRQHLDTWLSATPLFQSLAARLAAERSPAAWGHLLLEGLLDNGHLQRLASGHFTLGQSRS